MTLWAVLLASILGSGHCAAMCGLIAGAAGRNVVTAASYQASRLAGYVTLGALAGTLGGAADWLGTWAGVAGLATRLAGALLVVTGAVTLLRGVGWLRPGWSGGHGWLAPLAARGRALAPVPRAALLGLVTALLPCGMLYAFVVVAGGTATPAAGALVMAACWLGTTPAVTAAGQVVARLSGPTRARLPLVSAAILIVFGLVTLFARPVAAPDARDVTHHVRTR